MRTFYDFREVPVGDTFWSNGNEYVKRTTRTARLIKYNRIFYFRNDDLVRII